jgi:hypothetical protein
MPKKEDGNKNGRKVKQIKKVKNKMMTTWYQEWFYKEKYFTMTLTDLDTLHVPQFL